ncbi:hypothetical protein [uncultured Bacteroides sp.]|uniref:hypothetical protein n=1 Tax=uncultured Bacteroides sp. TaxID=162156 RepID=UPI002AA75DCB|nr:hypothetical protein [uncultured Bacteroides sp.]
MKTERFRGFCFLIIPTIFAIDLIYTANNNYSIKNYHYIFFALATLFLAECGHNADEKLRQAENLLGKDSDSTLTLLKQLDIDGLSNSQKANYGLYLCAAHQIKNQSLCEDSIILFSLAYFKQHANTQEVYESYHFASRYYVEQKNFPLAIKMLNDGLILAKNNNDTTAIGGFYDSKIQYYYEECPQIYPDQLLCSLNENAQYTKGSSNDYTQGIVRALGIIQDNDSSYFYLNRSIEKALRNNDVQTACHYLKNYAQVLLSNGKLDDAIACIQRIHKLFPAYNHKMIPVIKAYIYIYKGDLEAAEEELRTINRMGHIQDFGYKYIVSQMESILNYNRSANVNLINQSHYADSMMYIIKRQQLENAAKTESKARLQQKNMELKITRERTQFVFLFLIGLLILGFVLYDRRNKEKYIALQKKLNEYKIKILEESSRTFLSEAERAASENNLVSIRQEKLQFCIAVFKKETWFKKLVEIEHYSKDESKFLSQKERKQLMDSLLTVFADVMIDLKSVAPQLNSDEQIYCIFTLLGFSNHTISICTAFAESTLRMRKSRVKSKLPEVYFNLFF